MTSPLRQAPAICLEEGGNLSPDLLCALTLVLILTQAAGATFYHHVKQHDCKPSAAPKRGCLYSEDNDDGHYHRPDKSDSVFTTFSAPKTKRDNRTQK
jgi:hypothetical protein